MSENLDSILLESVKQVDGNNESIKFYNIQIMDIDFANILKQVKKSVYISLEKCKIPLFKKCPVCKRLHLKGAYCKWCGQRVMPYNFVVISSKKEDKI